MERKYGRKQNKLKYRTKNALCVCACACHIDCFGGFLVGRPVSDFHRRPASSGPAAIPLPCLASSCEWRVLRSARGRAIVVMGVASFSASWIIHSRVCLPSGQPFFFGGFGFSWSLQFLFDAISLNMYVRTSFSGPRRWVWVCFVDPHPTRTKYILIYLNLS